MYRNATGGSSYVSMGGGVIDGGLVRAVLKAKRCKKTKLIEQLLSREGLQSVKQVNIGVNAHRLKIERTGVEAVAVADEIVASETRRHLQKRTVLEHHQIGTGVQQTPILIYPMKWGVDVDVQITPPQRHTDIDPSCARRSKRNIGGDRNAILQQACR